MHRQICCVGYKITKCKTDGEPRKTGMSKVFQKLFDIIKNF